MFYLPWIDTFMKWNWVYFSPTFVWLFIFVFQLDYSWKILFILVQPLYNFVYLSSYFSYLCCLLCSYLHFMFSLVSPLVFSLFQGIVFTLFLPSVFTLISASFKIELTSIFPTNNMSSPRGHSVHSKIPSRILYLIKYGIHSCRLLIFPFVQSRSKWPSKQNW